MSPTNDAPHLDAWRLETSQTIGRMESKIDLLVEMRAEDGKRITSLEARLNRAGGVVAAVAVVLPFFTDKLKSFFFGA